MSINSRILKTGNNKITQTYNQHVTLADSGKAWAKGIDVVKDPGCIDYVIAHTDGVVFKIMTGMVNSETDSEGMGYGNYVMIKHTNNLVTLYAHLSSVMVKIGDKVKKGQSVGIMGNSGRSFGAHLHFEIRKYSNAPDFAKAHDTRTFKWMDPTPYLNSSLFPESSPQPNIIENRYKVKVEEEQKGAFTSLDSAINLAKNCNGYIYDSSEDCIIYRSKSLNANSYPNYVGSGNKCYRIRKSWFDSQSQIGAFSVWSNAYSLFSKNLSHYHIYNNDGKQLD